MSEERGPAEPIRVYLLDDHEVVRRGIKDLLQGEGDIVVVGESGPADDALFSATMAGASGYVLKQVRGTDLVDAVRRVAAGQSDPAVTAQVLERSRSGPRTDPTLDQLTSQERRILELIAQGMTNRQLAGALFLAEKTVKNYVSSLLAKLDLESRTQAAIFATKHLED